MRSLFVIAVVMLVCCAGNCTQQAPVDTTQLGAVSRAEFDAFKAETAAKDKRIAELEAQIAIYKPVVVVPALYNQRLDGVLFPAKSVNEYLDWDAVCFRADDANKWFVGLDRWLRWVEQQSKQGARP